MDADTDFRPGPKTDESPLDARDLAAAIIELTTGGADGAAELRKRVAAIRKLMQRLED